MKHSLLSVMISCLLFVCAGCAGSAASRPAQESTAPAAESAAPATAQESSAPAAESAAPAPAESAAPEQASAAVDEEQAKAIALKDASVSENDVTFMQVKADVEKGVDVFDVEFIAGDTEYDYEIIASSGEIRSKDRDIEAVPDKPASSEIAAITQDDALKIALDDAGLKQADVTVTELNNEVDDGIELYNVEFTANGMEYDYEIRASDGTILESDSEPAKD